MSARHASGLHPDKDKLTPAGNSQAQVWSCAGREIGVWENGNYTAIVEQQRSEQLTPPIITGGRDGACWVAADGRLRKFTRSGCATDYGTYPWSKGDVVRMLEDHLGNLVKDEDLSRYIL